MAFVGGTKTHNLNFIFLSLVKSFLEIRVRTWSSGFLTFKVARYLVPQGFTFPEQQDKALVVELGVFYLKRRGHGTQAQRP